MYCYNCGKEVHDEAVVCTSCGAWLSETPSRSGQQGASEGNGMAIAGFICSFFVPLLGWIFGGIGLSSASKKGGKGKGLSIGAIVIASVMFLMPVILLITEVL